MMAFHSFLRYLSLATFVLSVTAFLSPSPSSIHFSSHNSKINHVTKGSCGEKKQFSTFQLISLDSLKKIITSSVFFTSLSFLQVENILPFSSIHPARADGSTTRFVLPPVDTKDNTRCKFKSSAMGQANAARDKLYDLRMCDMGGQDAGGYDLSGVIATDTNFAGTNFQEAILSKAYLKKSNFLDADFSNAVVDRVTFEGSNLKNAQFNNAVLSGTSFADANLENTDFSETYMGEFDLAKLCKNPTLKGENPFTGLPSRESAGCRNN